jgi:glycosyltransferase involved in cell wall biosynthesis
MKKVLVVSYYFPPAGGSAVQRVLKFVKYLPENGWEPVVLTAKEGKYPLRDDSLMAEVPGHVRIVRTSAPDLYSLYGRMGRTRAPEVELSALGDRNKSNPAKKFALWIRSAFFIPDARVAWLPFALSRGLRLIRKEKIDVIFTTSPPFTTALVGGLLSILSGRPWISDYRDPWTQAYFYFRRPRFSKLFEEFLERHLLRRADRVLAINKRMVRGLKDKYRMSQSEKWAVIPNGYDPEDFTGLAPSANDAFTVLYAGTVHATMHPGPILEAMAGMTAQNPGLEGKMRLDIIGRISPDILALFIAPDSRPLVRLIGYMPHRRCLQAMAGADLLVLAIPEAPNNELIVTGKLFEYLRSGRPILCLSERGDAADIVRGTGSGFCVKPADIQAIASILTRGLERRRAGRPMLSDPPDMRRIEMFDRRRNTKTLAGVFDEVCHA